MLFLKIVIILIILQPDVSKRTLVGECIVNEDCYVPVEETYCGVEYGCVAGKCYSNQQLCPEACSGGIDEDKDGLIDCKDPDCFQHISCHCSRASFNYCSQDTCYCPSPRIPRWYVFNEDSYCDCK